MSTNWTKLINESDDNISLVSQILLRKLIKPWLSKYIIDAFFNNSVQKSWNYIYKKDIAFYSQAIPNNRSIIDTREICRFLGVTNLDNVCNLYNQLSDNEKKSVTPEQLGLNLIPLDSDYLDLQSMVKILRFRVNDEPSKHNISYLHEWAYKIIRLRNDIAAHEMGYSTLKWTNTICKEHISEIIALTKAAKQSADTEWSHFGGGLKEAFSRLEDKLITFLNAYINVIDGITLNMDEFSTYHSDDLFGYNVLFAFVDTSNDYTRSFINELREWYSPDNRNQRFYIDSSTIDKTVLLSKNNQIIKILVKDLSSHKDNGSLSILDTESADLYQYRTDKILEHIQTSDTKWCIITGDEYFASDIRSLNNPDIVVMKVTDRKTIAPFLSSATETVKFSFRFADEPTPTKAESSVVDDNNITSTPINHASTVESKPAETRSTEEPAYTPEPKTQYSTKETRSIPKRGGIVFHESDSNPQYLYTEISKGGEGVIYSTGMGNTYVKLYHDHTWSEHRADKISAMRAFAPDLPETICWPLQAIYHPDRSPEPIGYEMLNVKYVSPEAIPLDELLYDLSYENPWKWNRKNLVRLCQTISKRFSALHKYEIIMGDVNPKNIMVSQTGEVWFIDTDSYQFSYNGTVYRCEVGTPEFSSPNLHMNKCKFREIDRTLNDEYFAIACLFFQILFLGESPFPTEAKNVRYSIINKKFRLFNEGTRKHNYKWGNLTKGIQKAFEDTFSKGIYIDEDIWLTLLREMETCITKKELSNMLDPTSAPLPGLPFEHLYVECIQCHEKFEFFKSRDLTPDDKFCPSCKKSRNILRTKIIRLRCSRCGDVFTVNKWDMVRRYQADDLSEFDTDNALCPDCDNNLCVPNEYKFNSDHSEIERAMENAYRNSNMQWRLLMYGETES